ncbi:MAG TPA: rhomboid family intramembrane serine protease [Pyrinomonadaceae bacterium]|jgi:rhomboid protease GluP
MSLEYRNEEAARANVRGETEGYQRATFVFPLYTVILIGCLFAVFAGQLFADGQNSALEGGSMSVVLAGFVKQFFREGQYWRILTGAALHGGLIHLAFNCYALYVLGKLIETLSNRAHLAIVFLLSALGGGILSLIFLPEIPSVGASGGIVGFLGYLTVYGFKRRKLLPEGFLKNMLFNVGLIAFVGIFLMSNVDNFGHLGGLIAGAVYGLIQIPSDLYRDPREISGPTRIFGVAALGAFILTCAFSLLILLGVITIPIPEIYLTQPN